MHRRLLVLSALAAAAWSVPLSTSAAEQSPTTAPSKVQTACLPETDASSPRHTKLKSEQPNPKEIIFTDIDMPGSMDGVKLAHFVKDRWPPIKIIATSGHAKITANDLPQGVRFMPKPYKVTEVADTIHQLIHTA